MRMHTFENLFGIVSDVIGAQCFNYAINKKKSLIAVLIHKIKKKLNALPKA